MKAARSPCPSDSELSEFAEGVSDGRTRDRIMAHLDACDACRGLVASVVQARTGDGAQSELMTNASPTLIEGGSSQSSGGLVPRPNSGVVPGQRVGRYVVIERVGSGAMGQVFMAFDPTLSRKIALKVLRPELVDDDAGQSSGARDRMLREAQAAAQLTHPNVTTVYEAGSEEDVVFIAMEFVEGGNLRDWLEDPEAGARPWRDVIEKFQAAGRGLAAAHDAGILHRDFKPDNVLLDRNGVAKVTDFGLAGIADDVPLDLSSGIDGASTIDVSGDARQRMTQTGHIMGTPAYMAPEQHRTAKVDPRADLYAFCVALYEALHGVRPFAGKTIKALYRAKLRQEFRPEVTDVPRWLDDIVRRGLAPDPNDRPASMHDLLALLAYDPDLVKRTRRTRAFIAVATIGMVGLGSALALDWMHGAAAQCSGGAALISSVWNADRRARVSQTMDAMPAPFVHEAWSRTAESLDDYAHAWTAAHTEACEATAIRKEQSEQVMDLRMTCLHRARLELDAVLRVLEDADLEVVRKSHELIEQLPPLEWCADVDALRSRVPPPPADGRETVDEARRRIADGEMQHAAGRYERAEATFDEAATLVEAAGYEPIRAEYALARADLANTLGEYDDALRLASEALGVASKYEQSEQMERAARKLFLWTGDHKQSFEAAQHFLPLARALAGEDRHRLAALAHAEGSVYLVAGENKDAIEAHERAIALATETARDDESRLAPMYAALSEAFREDGQLDAALGAAERSLAIRTTTLGPEHPVVATSHVNIALVMWTKGDHEGAIEHTRTAIDIMTESLGPTHPDIATARNNLGAFLASSGEIEAAEKEFRASLAAREATPDVSPVTLADCKLNIANLVQARGDLEGAERTYREAMALYERELGAQHPRTADARNNLAATLHLQGRFEQALAQHELVLEARVASLGADHQRVFETRTGIAELLLEMGETERALETAEAVLSEMGDAEVAPEIEAMTRFVLAQALWSARTDRASRSRARDLASQADAQLAAWSDDPRFAAVVSTVKDWLSAHPA